MNRTRQTVRLLCGAAMQQGMAVIYPDLHGTGDSAGDFGDARWEQWLGDLETAAAWLQERGCTAIVVLGIRAGALLAWELLRRGRFPVHSLVFWQPVLSGKSVVTDMLRMRIAAAGEPGSGETVAGLRQQAGAGAPLEAAGYRLAPELVQALDASSIDAVSGMVMPPIHWLEIVSEDAGPTRQAVLDTIARLRGQGARIELLRQPDPPFWATQEITVGQGTVAATVRLLAAAA